jgi:hypothetical protein
VLALSVLLVSGACGGSEKPPGPNLGDQAGALMNDTRVVREAQAAVNVVVRATGDCDEVKATKDEALRQLDEAAPRVRTVGGQQQLDALRKRLNAVVESCP